MFFGSSRQRKILQDSQIDIAEPGIQSAESLGNLTPVGAEIIILPDKSLECCSIRRIIKTNLVGVGGVCRNVNQIVGETVSVNITGLGIRVAIATRAGKSIPLCDFKE